MIERLSRLPDMQLWLVFVLLIAIGACCFQLAYGALTLHDQAEFQPVADSVPVEAPPSKPVDTVAPGGEPADEAAGAS